MKREMRRGKKQESRRRRRGESGEITTKKGKRERKEGKEDRRIERRKVGAEVEMTNRQFDCAQLCYLLWQSQKVISTIYSYYHLSIVTGGNQVCHQGNKRDSQSERKKRCRG